MPASLGVGQEMDFRGLGHYSATWDMDCYTTPSGPGRDVTVVQHQQGHTHTNDEHIQSDWYIPYGSAQLEPSLQSPEQSRRPDPPDYAVRLFAIGAKRSVNIFQCPLATPTYNQCRMRSQALVPQLRYTPKNWQRSHPDITTYKPITFASRSGEDGILLDVNLGDLVGRDDRVFEGLEFASMNLRLQVSLVSAYLGKTQ